MMRCSNAVERVCVLRIEQCAKPSRVIKIRRGFNRRPFRWCGEGVSKEQLVCISNNAGEWQSFSISVEESTPVCIGCGEERNSQRAPAADERRLRVAGLGLRWSQVKREHLFR